MFENILTQTTVRSKMKTRGENSMKKIFQLIIIYGLGILFVMTFVWRASSLDRANNNLASNYENDIQVNYN